MYELEGTGFGRIPMDAVGLSSTNNGNPRQYLNQIGQTDLTFYIESKTNTRMVLRVMEEKSHSLARYLGCIASPDGQEVYWENNSQPLP